MPQTSALCIPEPLSIEQCEVLNALRMAVEPRRRHTRHAASSQSVHGHRHVDRCRQFGAPAVRCPAGHGYDSERRTEAERSSGRGLAGVDLVTILRGEALVAPARNPRSKVAAH